MNQKWNDSYRLIDVLLRVRRIHLRGLAVQLGIPLTTLLRLVRVLESANVIDLSFEGKNKIIALKNTIQSRLMIREAEYSKARELVRVYPELSIILNDLINQTRAMVVVFGSYARFEASRDSDIDVYVETTSRSLRRSLESIHSKLSVKIGTFNPRDNLGIEIIKNHVIIQGVERFYEVSR